MKTGTTDLIKFKRLQKRLGVSKALTVGVLGVLWETTARNTPRGDIGRLANEDIAAEMEWDGDADELVAALVAEKWLDTSKEHRLLVHDWPDHAPEFIVKKMRRLQEKGELGFIWNCPDNGSHCLNDGRQRRTTAAVVPTCPDNGVLTKSSLVKSSLVQTRARARASGQPADREEEKTSEIAAQAKPLDVLVSDRTTQGWAGKKIEARIGEIVGEHGLDALRLAIVRYARRMKSQDDWARFTVAFAKFFGEEERFAEFAAPDYDDGQDEEEEYVSPITPEFEASLNASIRIHERRQLGAELVAGTDADDFPLLLPQHRQEVLDAYPDIEGGSDADDLPEIPEIETTTARHGKNEACEVHPVNPEDEKPVKTLEKPP
jgi:hypothetical protein